MVVVDRSGSVHRSGSAAAIQQALQNFVDAQINGQRMFEEERDFIGMGSFANSWKLDFSPAAIFRSPITEAIRTIPFARAGSTNTAEALHQAYEQLRVLNKSRSLNAILFLTDGRPSSFTAKFDRPSACELATPKTGVIAATVGATWPPLPPSNSGDDGIYTMGLFQSKWTSYDLAFVEGTDCHFSTDSGQALPGASFSKDFSILPETDAYGNSLFGPVYQLEDRSTANPRSVRFAAFNAADNMATKIRKDRALRPVLFVVGLKQVYLAEESLDSAWLARVANDPVYLHSSDQFSLQTDQTVGFYREANFETLGAVLKQTASDIALFAAGRSKSLLLQKK